MWFYLTPSVHMRTAKRCLKGANCGDQISHSNRRRKIEMLSRDCDGCSQMKECNKRFNVIEVWEKVYCPDGTAHLVDGP
jgi:hypothetical protein